MIPRGYFGILGSSLSQNNSRLKVACYLLKALTITIIPIRTRPTPPINDRITDPKVSLFLYDFIEVLIKIIPTTITTAPKIANGIFIYISLNNFSPSKIGMAVVRSVCKQNSISASIPKALSLSLWDVFFK